MSSNTAEIAIAANFGPRANRFLHSNRNLYNFALPKSSLFGRTSPAEPTVILIRNW